jgi:hypothetical protein
MHSLGAFRERALVLGLAVAAALAVAEAVAEETFLTRLDEDISGFWEARGGYRTQSDPYEKSASVMETRLQLRYQHDWDNATIKLVPDLVFDDIEEDRGSIRLDEGRGWLDLREASLLLRPGESMDLKLGRQVLTWGTGDLLFINDLFPKDWNSFFCGRDQEYLKAPSDAAKLSLFHAAVNLDLVYVPVFDGDRSIDGRRISYWNSGLGRRAGRDAIVRAERPDHWLDDDELAARLYRTVGGYEVAAYGYHGFWKSPGGMDPGTGRAIYPDLNVWGASARGTVGRGIGHLEAGYYDSADDRDGDDPFVRNDEVRFLAGYEQDLWADFTLGVQYYLEWMQDYGDYRDTLPGALHAADEFRHVTTLRLTQRLLQQNLTLSLFAYYSPTDGDGYLRPNANYKVNDHWQIEAGGNWFFGQDDWTFFGQFERNTNAYLAVRYSF